MFFNSSDAALARMSMFMVEGGLSSFGFSWLALGLDFSSSLSTFIMVDGGESITSTSALGELNSESLGLALRFLPNVCSSGGDEPMVIFIPFSAFAAPSSPLPELVLLKFLFLREFGFVWILECLVSSSERENFLKHPGKEQLWGFSPVCVLMCLVWCSSLWNALSHIGHLYGLCAGSFFFASIILLLSGIFFSLF